MKKQLHSSEAIYVYYNRKKLALYVIFIFIMTCIYAYGTYKSIFYKKFIFTLPSGNFSIDQYVYTPFVWPDSLYTTSTLFLLLGSIGALLFFWFFLKRLLIRGPAFIITEHGITDHRNRLISWKEVFAVNEFVYGKNNRCVVIRLKNSKAYFGTYQSLWGKRPLVLDSSLMYYEQFTKAQSFFKSFL